MVKFCDVARILVRKNSAYIILKYMHVKKVCVNMIDRL
jgi:hypothetical protein